MIFGFVRSIVDEGPWWYSACVCGKSIQPQDGAYYCDFCQHYVTNVTPKYLVFIPLCVMFFSFLFLFPAVVYFSLFQ